WLKRQVALQSGSSTLEVPIEITRPRRWWPVGYGAQDRYTVKARIGSGQGEALSSSIRTGLRTVELLREEDSDDGQGFGFAINGVPVFAKGVNAIPFDAFPARVTRERLRRALQSARDANMNMVRNRGGGYYESEDFFDIANAVGLLVWQDFMCGGGRQPGFDPGLRASVVAEARDNIRRL